MKLRLASCGWLLLAASSHLGVVAKKKEKALDYGVFDWIHNAEGGYFNPKQEFRNLDPKDSESQKGVFAKERIEKDELLLTVPWKLIIKPDDPDDDGQMPCGTVESLARKLKSGASSSFGPYMEYLNDLPMDDLPSGWTEPGKVFLQAVVGGIFDPEIPPEEPTEWLTEDWYGRCEGDPNDIISAKAALLVVQRADDSLLIPGYDMMNHRNPGFLSGRWLNTESETFADERMETRATRVIQPGEEIHNTYNFCKDCSGRRHNYGTAEILRDYGFIENFPQKWHYHDMNFEFFVDIQEDGTLQLKWDGRSPKDKDRQEIKVWFENQVRRLRRVRNINYPTKPDDIPDQEWETANEFLDANLRALVLALQAMDAVDNGGEKNCPIDTTDDLCWTLTPDSNLTKPHYEHFQSQVDHLPYKDQTCDNAEIMMFEDYDTTETLDTHYQTLNFAQRPSTDDICMDLDDIVQICSCYRPQYHEYSVHGAARYLDEVKKVIFIGGGDSMLLHEVLKYPSLELVVGLELDQHVVRKSFKHFKTSPHFDDPRVEWWFGDATKSLLLLPEEYWGTFDLVLVDLSETVMSLSVTSELDVFDALAFLLTPEGIMVKNELYFSHLAEVFDHAIHLYYESPIICSQSMAMGSNRVDFLHHKPKDHGIDTFLYEGLHEDHNKLDYYHDYRKSNATEQGKCGNLPSRDDYSDDQGRSAGLLEIIDAEDCTVALDESLKGKISETIKSNGFELVSEPLYEPGLIFVEMKEGYVMAKMWPELNYVAFDINLWGSFHKLKTLSKAIASTVGSSTVSNFRVVVGGMYGCSTWREDKKIIGPQIVQNRNCGEKPIPAGSVSADNLLESIFEEAMSLIQPSKSTAVVFCGSEDCVAESLLKKTDRFDVVHKVMSCAGIEGLDVTDDSSALKMYECERSMVREIDEALYGSKLDVLLLDSSLSFEMFQILNSMLESNFLRQKWINEQNVVMAWSTNPEEEVWRQIFLDRYRKQHRYDPITRGMYSLMSKDSGVNFGVVTTEDEEAIYKMEHIESRLRAKFLESEKEVGVELLDLQSGTFPFIEDFNPKTFKQSDYDNKPGLTQYTEQRPLGRQIVFQFEPAGEEDTIPTFEDINWALEKAMGAIRFMPTNKHTVKSVGDGALLVYFAAEGHAVVVWDGKQHIDINFFMKDDRKHVPDKFSQTFIKKVEPVMKVALRDDMPRGTGRVINLLEDIGWKGMVASS